MDLDRHGEPLTAPASGSLLFRHVLVRALLATVVGALAGCAAPSPEATLVDLVDLPGWSAENVARAKPALLSGCRVMAGQPEGALTTPIAPIPLADWRKACDDMFGFAGSSAEDFASLLNQTLVAVTPGGQKRPALITGYYEPEFEGALQPSDRYRWPLLRPPADPGQFDRAEIASGALSHQGLEIAYLADPFDAFTIQVQGSGRVRLPDGGVIRLGYAANNGREYVAIGKLLVEAGLIAKEKVSMPSIRAYLASHPDETESWLNRNPRYVFFREMDGPGPVGAANVVLSPMASVAVDPAFLALGQPIWLNAAWPDDGGGHKKGESLPLLVVALDKGGAIKGEGRFDLFWGSGDIAEAMAGKMRIEGFYFVIAPRAWAERRFASGS